MIRTVVRVMNGIGEVIYRLSYPIIWIAWNGVLKHLWEALLAVVVRSSELDGQIALRSGLVNSPDSVVSDAFANAGAIKG